jgi:hypothetical protein
MNEACTEYSKTCILFSIRHTSKTARNVAKKLTLCPENSYFWSKSKTTHYWVPLFIFVSM